MGIKSKPKTQRDTQDQILERLSRPRADESKRLHVPVPPDLYQRMRLQAVHEDRSLAEITRELWTRYLDE